MTTKLATPIIRRAGVCIYSVVYLFCSFLRTRAVGAYMNYPYGRPPLQGPGRNIAFWTDKSIKRQLIYAQAKQDYPNKFLLHILFGFGLSPSLPAAHGYTAVKNTIFAAAIAHRIAGYIIPEHPVAHGEKTCTCPSSSKTEIRSSRQIRKTGAFDCCIPVGSSRLAEMGIAGNGHHRRLLSAFAV